MSRWEGKRVVMIGAARQGLALSRYLASQGAKVTLNDQRTELELKDPITALSMDDITWVTGGHPFDILDDTDLVCLSGGIPLSSPIVQEAVKRDIPLSNDSQIFLEEAPCPVIGITGSSGKTTTTALVGEIANHHFSLRKPDRRVWVGGNIGYPLIQDLTQMDPNDLAVMELSSFQLEIMDRSPQVATLLNLTPNHLDRHQDMAHYISAKAQILTHQSTNDIAVMNRDDPNVRKLFPDVKGRLITFGLNPPHDNQNATFIKRDKLYLQASGQIAKIAHTDQVNLRGQHNLYNVLAALAISAAAAFSIEAIYEGVTGFTGVSHRLELVREWGGVKWYNDSIATSPERAIAALNSFEEPIVLLAGGRDKNLPWQHLAKLIHQKVDHLVLFGDAANLIYHSLGSWEPETRPFTVDICAGLEQAVQRAAQHVTPGDVVLLSPGGTSYDEFLDFEERGKKFKQWVNELS